MARLSFANDYSTGAHPEVLRALCETNAEALDCYGTDVYCDRAKEKIRRACSAPDAVVEFLTGGTQTNAVVLSALLAGHEGAVAVDTGHIAVHEAGAIEYTGHKVLTLPHHAGKMDASELDAYVTAYYNDANYTHMVFPGAVYLSHPTEFGTLYTLRELEEISSVCKKHGMRLYVDGARLAYGLTAPGTDVTLADLARLCDAFTIGGTKVGCLCGEAVVFQKAAYPRHFITHVKQHGAMLAKGRIVGVQYDALFTDELYLRIGRHVNGMALRLRKALEDAGLPFHLQSPTNQQFVVLDNARMEALREHVSFSFWEVTDKDHTVVRFCTAWSTTPEDVDALSALLRSAAN